jgi:hypothetical protein
MKAALALGLAVAAACGGRSSAVTVDAAAIDAGADALPDPRRQLVPGVRVGPIALGMRWAEVIAAIGAPPSEPVVLVRLGHATWPALGLEALVTSPDEAILTADALVIGAGATVGAELDGPVRPGDARASIEAAMGAPPEEYGGRAYYPAGLAVEYDTEDRARRIGVVAAFTLVPEPPPMAPAPELP